MVTPNRKAGQHDRREHRLAERHITVCFFQWTDSEGPSAGFVVYNATAERYTVCRGPAYELISQQIKVWQRHTPDEQDVIDFFERYAEAGECLIQH